jgi:hypothetical protein
MLIRREFERRGNSSLVETRTIGIDGNIEDTAYTITGPRPGQFRDLKTAQAWFNSTPTASEARQTESVHAVVQ